MARGVSSKSKHNTCHCLKLPQDFPGDSNCATGRTVGRIADAKQVRVGPHQCPKCAPLQSHTESIVRPKLQSTANRKGEKCLTVVTIGRYIKMSGANCGSKIWAHNFAVALVRTTSLQVVHRCFVTFIAGWQTRKFGISILLRVNDFPLRIRSLAYI